MSDLTTKKWLLGFASASLITASGLVSASDSGDEIRAYNSPPASDNAADAVDLLMDGDGSGNPPMGGITSIPGIGPEIDSQLATIIGTPNSGGGENPAEPLIAAVTGIADGCATGTAPDTCQPAIEGAVATLTGDGQTPPTPTGVSALVDTIAVTVTGTVNNNLNCTVLTTDTEFDFGAIDPDGTTTSSDPVAFSVTCDNETVATNIFLSTNANDPQSTTGSNELSADFDDGTNTASVNLSVLTDDAGDQSTGTAIGGTTPNYTSGGNGTPTAIALFAQLNTNQITSGSGGTLSGTGNITVWVD